MSSRLFTPRDRNRTEHIGAIDRVIFPRPGEAAAGDFVIIALTDGGTVLGPGDPDNFPRGSFWRFLGKWEDSPERGPRFRFQTAVVHHGHSRTGVVTYLTKSCTGIGEKAANRLFDKYGGSAVEQLRTNPATVAADCGLNPDTCATAAAELHDSKKYEATRVDLFGMFSGRGFSGKLIEEAIRRWDVRAPQVIKRNPFCLLGLPSAGFNRCDRLWSDLALPPNALKRQAICAANAVKNEANGHTWLQATILADILRNLIPTANPARAFKFALRARKLKKYRDAAGTLWLADYHRATAEERIAARVYLLSQRVSQWPADRIPVSRTDTDRLPSAHQVERLTRATREPVGLLLGGPGTGKSHSLAYLLREVIADYGRSSVCVCAPTGKAAVRASQALAIAGVDVQAKTIHGTLKIGRNGHDGDGWGFEHGPGNPLPFRFVVVDESSMIDTSLLADLIDACGVGTHVLLTGDVYQLPPVGHGAPLRDLIDAGVPHGELTEVRRNAGQIVHACVRIKNGESFDTADTVDLDATPPKNLKLLATRDEADSRDTLVKLLGSMTKFDPVWQTQIIVARNAKGELSRKRLNELLHPLLNPDGYAVAGNPFKVGDKIICTRNSRMHRVEPIGTFHDSYAADMAREAANYQVVCVVDEFGGPTRDPEEVYVANGEIGRVVAVAKGLSIARFSEGDALVKIPMGKDREAEGDGDGPRADGEADSGRGCNFDHAYAITVHRAQGSEWPCIIVAGDPNAGMIANREWIYTAISRASKLCILVGQMSTFDKMRARQSMVRRKTFLKELLVEMGAVAGEGDAGGQERRTAA